MVTNLPDVGVGEVIHEKADSPGTESLVTGRKGLVKLNIINEATPINIS